MSPRITRRTALQGIAAAASLTAFDRSSFAAPLKLEAPLEEFGYDQVAILGTRQLQQRENVLSVLASLNDDSLLYPFRAMSGKPASGTSLHGWYEWLPNYDFHRDTAGLAPGATFGQWVSALTRFYQQSRFGDAPGDPQLAERPLRLNKLLAGSIGPGYFEKTLFPAYSYDKLVVGLMDAHRLAGDTTTFTTLDRITDFATPSLPGRAIPRDTQWKLGKGLEWMWDESYTVPENLYLISTMGADPRYRRMAAQYLEDVRHPLDFVQYDQLSLVGSEEDLRLSQEGSVARQFQVEIDGVSGLCDRVCQGGLSHLAGAEQHHACHLRQPVFDLFLS